MYYPHIEFQNEAWVKSCLLLWNHVYRIVPEGYTPNDSDEIKALVDADLVRNIKLDDKDREDTFDEFLIVCLQVLSPRMKIEFIQEKSTIDYIRILI